MIVNGTPGNITQIPNRSHSDLQNLVNNDHPWYSAEPNRLALSSFTEGLDASKSATPSVGNVYYATDTKRIYICFATNTWTQVDDVAVPHGAAQGDTIYFDGAKWNRLAAGTAGNVLTTQGAGANPSWTAAGLASSGTAFGTIGASATGSYSITGLSFQPSIVEIFGYGTNGNANVSSVGSLHGIGFSNASVHCVYGGSENNGAQVHGINTSNLIYYPGTYYVSAYVASLTSLDSAGFTIDVTTYSAAWSLQYVAHK